MKWVRFRTKNAETSYGILDGDKIWPITGSMYDCYQETGECLHRAEVELLPPCEPTKIFCIGSNYIAHIRECNFEMPVFPASFMKPVTAAIPSGARIVIPANATRVDYEGEMAFVVKDQIYNVEPEEAKKHIFGVTAFNDVTERDLMKYPLQLTYGKSFDTFAPFGPFIDTDIDPDQTIVRTYLNGEKVQEDSTADTVFKAGDLLSYLSRAITFYPGDIISTGTPFNVQPMKDGDIVEVEIEGMGERLVNPVYDPQAHK